MRTCNAIVDLITGNRTKEFRVKYQYAFASLHSLKRLADTWKDGRNTVKNVYRNSRARAFSLALGRLFNGNDCYTSIYRINATLEVFWN